MEDPTKGEPVTPVMDMIREKLQSYGSLDKLKLIIIVGWELQNKETIKDNLSLTSSTITLEYFPADSSKHKARVHQLYLIGALQKSNVKHKVFVKVYRRYGKYFPEYFNYFGIPLIPKESMYGMKNSGNYLLMISQTE